MELVLKTDEGLICGFGELEIAQDRTGDIRSDLRGFFCDGDALHLALRDVQQPVVWCRMLAAENVQVQRNSYTLLATPRQRL